MTAALLAKKLNILSTECTIHLVESEQIGTVGVGEATIPHIRTYNQSLGLDENEFMRRTNATYKLGIELTNWGKIGNRYLHPFGSFGHEINGVPFHHFWLKHSQSGNIDSLEDYSLPIIAAKKNKFAYPQRDSRSIFSTYSYAFHLDASLYAKYLREVSESLGVKRIEGKVIKVSQYSSGSKKGCIQNITLENGDIVSGELFIDCTGFRALLIEQTLKTGYEDWTHWLPCNSAVTVPSENIGEPFPYTRSIARQAGWQWQIPLQHRTGNGHVYCNQYISDDEAAGTLLDNTEGSTLAEPKFLRFTTGRRKLSWNYNCIAIGLSSGFLEPLESTSIYLIQIAITRLLELFPDNSFDPTLRNEFNSAINLEYERVRDFLILHYYATERDDTAFWTDCRTMSIPETLQTKINLFKQQGYVQAYEIGLFLEPSWVAVYYGQGVIPDSYDIRANNFSNKDLKHYFAEIKTNMHKAVASMPSHAEALRKNCYANSTHQMDKVRP